MSDKSDYFPPGISAGEWSAFAEQGVVPSGWSWCPDCNGEGVIYVMNANPDLTEHSYQCKRCEVHKGIVPSPSSGYQANAD